MANIKYVEPTVGVGPLTIFFLTALSLWGIYLYRQKKGK